MEKAAIYTPKVAKTKPPYSQGVSIKGGRIVFTSGLTARNPQGEIVAKGDIRGQTRQVLENLLAVVEEAGGSLQSTFDMTVYLRRDEDYDGMNEVRREFFGQETFVSATIICDLHAPEALVEIKVAAVVD